MPLSFVRSGNPRIYLPGYRTGISSSAFDAAVSSAYSGIQNRQTYGEFDQGQVARFEQGRADLNANQLVSLAIKAPAYALEAPLRPADALLGGIPGQVAGGIQSVVSQVPVLNSILGGIGEGLKYLDYAGAGFINYMNANALRESIGKPDNYKLGLFGTGQTAGEARRNALLRWGQDLEGNQYSLQELEQRASENPWDFGQFATSEDGLTDFAIRSAINPLNALFIPGVPSVVGAAAVKGAGGARYLAGRGAAMPWARPILKPTSPANPFRYGYQYASTMGRGFGKAYDAAHNPNPLLDRRFMDVGNAARDIMNGGLVRSGYNRSFIQAVAWTARGAKSFTRKVYLPGLNTELKGARLVGDSARAWMRGGIQQESGMIIGEYLTGGIDAYLDENNMQSTVIGGTINTIHDMLVKVNNQHPLSDQDGFVLAAMFLPFSRAAREIPSPLTNRWTANRIRNYGDNTAAITLDRSRKQFGTTFKDVDEMYTYLGDGDKALGAEKLAWFTEFMETQKVGNQLQHLTHLIANAELDGLAMRNAFIAPLIKDALLRRRTTGALQPGSTVDYMFDMHKTAGREPGRVKPVRPGEQATETGLSSQFTPTATSFFDEVKTLYQAHADYTPQLTEHGLSIEKGGVLSRELMDTIIAHFDATDTFDQQLARDILDMGPSLVYGADAPFWREFSISLGQPAKAGLGGRKITEAEAITREELRSALVVVRDRLPSEQELFHETIQMAAQTGTIRKGVIQARRETPYPMGAKLKANHIKRTGRNQIYAVNDRKMTEARSAEFAKNGSPRFGTADEVTSSRGTAYKRQPNGSYARDDGVAVNITDGAVRVEIPVTRDADLMNQLKRTIFQSGPRRGQIKPGMEQESQRLNREIEDVRMGIDEDALLLATENGGRVIVADTIAGPRLADFGYTESALIEHKYQGWVDPGDKPVPPEPIGYDPPETSGHFEEDGAWVPDDGPNDYGGPDPEWSAYDSEYNKWQRAMREGVFRGDISAEEATKRGFDLERWRSQRLEDRQILAKPPDILYHATTDIQGIRNKGMLPREETGNKGLGGGPADLVSFTDDPAVAQRIADVYIEAGQIVRGEKPLSDLAEIAKREGFYDWWEKATPYKTDQFNDMVYKNKYIIKEQVPDGTVKGGGIKWKWVDAEAPERWKEQARLNLYNKFLRTQGSATGIMDPVMVATDVKRVKTWTSGNVGVIKARPTSSKVMGLNDEAEMYLKEWKMEPATVELEGISHRAAYAFRGGNPHAIKQTQAVGAMPRYRPTKRIERSESAAIGVARFDARRSSLLQPAEWQVGEPMTPQTSMFPEARRQNLNEHIRATRNKYKQELQATSELDEIALSLLPFDQKITDMNLRDWLDNPSPAEMVKFQELISSFSADYPQLSLSPTPRIIVDPSADRFTMMRTTLNTRQRMLIDYGPLSPIQRFYDALLAPKHARWLGKQAQDEVHNLLTVAGWSPGATRNFMSQVRKEVLESKAVVGMGKFTGAHMWPTVQAVPEQKLRAIARDISPAEAQAVIDRYGSFQHMITQASNRMLRTTERKARSGKGLNKIEAAADAGFRFWQYAPGFRGMSGAGQRFTKYTYPMLRFAADPLFVMMNWLEPYTYNVMNNGWRGRRPPSEQSERLADLASAGLIPPGGMYTDKTPTELLLADPGFYTIPQNIRPNMVREFELKTQKSAEQVFEAMSKDHPVATMMRERFGDNIKDWAGEFNRLMATMVKEGPEHVTRKAWRDTLEKELGYTHAELKELAPVAERLGERYRGIYSDLADLYIGRMNRSNLERFANNFFIMWPISYMVKVTGWAYRIMMEKIGPVQGSAGALLWDTWRQRYEQFYENDPDFQRWTDENPDFLFAMEMLAPITPASIGVSVNKTTRYVGNWVANEYFNTPNVFGNYTPESVTELAESSLRMGPIRTWNMAHNVLSDFGVPGFYTEPTSNSSTQLTP